MKTRNYGPAGVEELIKSHIRDIPDYPKPGIVFKDITPLLKDSSTFNSCIDALAQRLSGTDFDYIVGIEARGFIIGGALAYKMKKGFVPVRKKGKLPYDKISKSYQLEYGMETMEMHSDAIEKNSRVIVVDDLLATGGTASATAAMINSLGGSIAGFAFITELSFLNGRERLDSRNIVVLLRY
ncbi:MAG: adenine phosphoribosyltransferase [Candidatus Marsarchaeota archaeon]|nr:adenine phosphoribosyltransferase [Candidatus Marsarchaeota archaeon]MCL5412869.1 adenine phosphoribosyltransferase [Candidatus Marsarchaeota archaeon]